MSIPWGEADVEWFMEAPDERVVRLLRGEVVAYLSRHAEPDSALEDAEMVVAELVGNAVRHGRGPIWVSLDWSAEEPVLTVRDVGHGFTMPDRLLLPPPTAAGGRGLYIVSQLARSLEQHPTRSRGAKVSAVLPVRRRVEQSFDPVARQLVALPTEEEAAPDGTFGRESFLRALVVLLADSAEARHGPDGAAVAVADVGAQVGGRMEDEFRRVEGITGELTVEQMGDLYVRLKAAIDGGFRVEESTPDKIVLANTRCPFGDVVLRSPSLCRMTSSVFGGIAARNVGGAAVHLEERIAVGDPECRVTVWLRQVPDHVRPFAHLYGDVARANDAVS